MPDLPQRTRTYQNHHMDSTRWDYFESRPGDIVIGSSYKAGTTWTQAIVAHLIFADGKFPASVGELSPWLDARTHPLELVLNGFRAQPHRRFIKTHLPLDGLPYDPEVRYLYVARDGRDVFMSLWNHYARFSKDAIRQMNETPGLVDEPLPDPPTDLHDLWRSWVTRGGFDWEGDGWPYWSHLYNVQSWWEWRRLPNIQLLHFADLLQDTEYEVRRIAAFLGIERTDTTFMEVAKAVSFQEMRSRGETYAPGGGEFWEGGANTFLHKGTNGRWRDVLSNEELALYDAACDRVLTPDCRAWLETGGAV